MDLSNFALYHDAPAIRDERTAAAGAIPERASRLNAARMPMKLLY